LYPPEFWTTRRKVWDPAFRVPVQDPDPGLEAVTTAVEISVGLDRVAVHPRVEDPAAVQFRVTEVPSAA
jgi:hypothetical protein